VGRGERYVQVRCIPPASRDRAEGEEMISEIADDILTRGEAAIDQMIVENREEALHLEFKTLASNNGLNRDDRKVIAKAISGFCNAEGGLLIIGIETKRVDGIDIAAKMRPVNEPGRLQNLIRAALPEMLSPQHNSISVESVVCSGNPDQGYILVVVPTSDNRPHMNLLEQRYFRRGSDGTRVLVHQEVRELMLATREGVLEIKCGIRSGVSTGDLKFELNLVLVIQKWLRLNPQDSAISLDQAVLGSATGGRPKKGENPNIIRVSSHGTSAVGDNLQTFMTRKSGKRHGIYGPRDVVVHIEDELGIAETSTGLDFRGTAQTTIKQAVQLVRTEGLQGGFRMLPFNQMQEPFGHRQLIDSPIVVSGSYGAENSPIQKFRFEIGKFELLDIFCENLSLN
jgi:Putative DNA-binding domain